MTTRLDALPEIARKLGGWSGTVSALAGDGKSVTLDNRVDVTDDDTYHVGDLLVFPSAAAAGDRSRLVKTFTPDTGIVAWTTARAALAAGGETYALFRKGDVTLDELWDNLNEGLRKARRTVEFEIPTISGEHVYRLDGAMPWLRSREDVDGVYRRFSPCLIPNEDFRVWGDGPAAAPTGFALSGNGASVARVAAGAQWGQHVARITRAGADVRLTRSVGALLGQLAGAQVTVRLDGSTTVAAALRVGVYDGVTTQTSATIATGRQATTATFTLDAAATACDVFAEMVADGDADLDRLLAVEGDTIPDQLADYGSTGYPRRPAVEYPQITPRDVGGATVLELDTPLARKEQLLVVSRQPYPELSADADDSDADVDLLAAAACYFLARNRAGHREGEDATRWAAVERDEGKAYLRAVVRGIQRPAPDPVRPVEVRGA